MLPKNEKFSLTEKKNSSNQLFSNFYSKTIAFTEFLRKKCKREFLQFPHCGRANSTVCENYGTLLSSSVRPKPKLWPKLRPIPAEIVRPKLRWRLPNHRIGKKTSFWANFGQLFSILRMFQIFSQFVLLPNYMYHPEFCKLLLK